MKRPLTTSFPVPPNPDPEPQAGPGPAPTSSWREVAPIVAALIATLAAIESGPKAGPAMRAHRSALRRQGEAATLLGGSDAMAAVLAQVADTDPARAAGRLDLIRDAWAGLPGWPG
ncbi:hypothetical protein [Methylobacterium sp. J-070]|uniref:hypothetical protein n=1 Tax=Methylobacterium sp. J-070 TaxID=2836650 RepID=UPI001FB9EFBD|nr:hypothetical protein [Methylobacterium sp. J-070]MCJ2054741.1 hypothetical protein [Methylobacterium sp. J-070]